MATPSTEAQKVLAELSREFGVSYSVLDALIKSESNWDPQIKNPTSSARGLIQFIDATARTLGFSSSLDLVQKYPDQVSQLRGPVRSYFRLYAPYANDDELLGAVFYPAFRKTPSKVLPDSVQKANPGIVTMADYIARVRRRLGVSVTDSVGWGVLLLVGIGAWLVFKR